MDKKMKQGDYCECLKCGDRISYDTNRKLIYCKCGAIAVDGWELETRILGKEEDYRSLHIDENGMISKPKPRKY